MKKNFFHILIIGFFILTHNAFSDEIINITFNVKLECDTPKGEVVCVGIGEGGKAYALNKVNDKEWSKKISIDDWGVGGTMLYRYCRNHVAFGADESFDNKNKMGWRKLKITNNSLSVNDVVRKWRWWPVDGVIPRIDDSSHSKVSPSYLPLPNFICGVQLPDWWVNEFSPYVEPTLDKIVKKAKANWIQYNPIPEITQFYPTPIIVREGENGTPEKELIKIITQAHKRGLKVFLNPFVWPFFVKDPSPKYHSDDWWRAYEAQWRPIISYYAKIAQQYRVEMINFSMWPSSVDSNDETRTVDELALQLLDSIRSIYKYSICISYDPYGPDLNVYGKSDNLGFGIWDFWPYQLSDSKNPQVAEMIKKLAEGLDGHLGVLSSRWGKQIILSTISSSSYDGTVIGKPYWESQLYYYKDDIKVPIDVQEQADAYEAILQTVSGRSWIKGAFSFNYNYWDSIDKAPSIRTKPAELVVAKWFKWMNPFRVTLSISISGQGTTRPGPASYVKSLGKKYTVTAIANPGYTFSGWSGNIPEAQKKTNPLIVLMEYDTSLIARFKKIETRVQEGSD
jgi:hypothetical protein